jgi:hypothetical protein
VRVRRRMVKGIHGSARVKSAPLWLLMCAITACGALAAGLGARDLDLPGLYYDEVIQAEPALAFLRRDPLPSEVPGIRGARLLGGWFPWMTQPYMGALKSQALIPTFALLDPGVAVLRGVTLAWAIAGLALAMVWANRALGCAAAIVTGGLLAVDPSFLFIARHDWGSFSLALLLRCGALVLLYDGHHKRSAARLFAGGLCAGLGVYNKIDFAVWLIAATAALLCVAPTLLRSAFRERRRETAAALAGLALGVAPIAIAAGGALAAAGAASRAQTGASAWSEKLAVAAASLDGSYFQRLILAGGRFEALPEVSEALAGPGLAVLAACVAGLLVVLIRERVADRWGPRSQAQAFVVLCLILTLAGLLLTPRAVRVHHYLNAWPFPQLTLAVAFTELWRRAAGAGGRGVALRLAVVALGVCVGLGSLRIDQATLETLRTTGGRGRWSDASLVFARTLPEATRLVALDWGFEGPLHFAHPQRRVSEPIWALRRTRDARLGVAIPGTSDDVYLVYEPEFAVFPYGGALLDALGSVPADSVSVSVHADREGRPVFRSIRFERPHRLVFRGERVEVRLR